jgi:hypothetical protein
MGLVCNIFVIFHYIFGWQPNLQHTISIFLRVPTGQFVEEIFLAVT